MTAQEAAAALEAARRAQFAQPVEGADLWIWSAPTAPDVDALLAIAIQVAGEVALMTVRLTSFGLQFAVSGIAYAVAWGSLDAKAMEAIMELQVLQSEIATRSTQQAASRAAARTEQEVGNGHILH